MNADGRGLDPDRFENACSECGSHRECMCRARARLKAVAKEIDAMGAVIDAARVAIGCFQRDRAAEEIGLRVAIDDYDDAVRAREACE